jgi:hypothetical protein
VPGWLGLLRIAAGPPARSGGGLAKNKE